VIAGSVVNARARGYLKSPPGAPMAGDMTASVLTDDELALVADVAVREGWPDLSRPPDAHGARSLAEQRAVARFEASVPRRARDERALRLRARLSLVVLTLGVLGVCWWISPTRTAIGLVGAGVFSLIAMRRARRRASRPARRRTPFG
jgi:hypothetical protein